jgi:hypothetical protein
LPQPVGFGPEEGLELFAGCVYVHHGNHRERVSGMLPQNGLMAECAGAGAVFRTLGFG